MSSSSEEKGRESGIGRPFNFQPSVFTARPKKEESSYIRASATTQLSSNNESFTRQGIGLEPRIPTAINRANEATAWRHSLRLDPVRDPEIVCRNHNNLPAHTNMKADTTYSASGVRKPYSTDAKASRTRQFHQIARGSPGTVADPEVDPVEELVAKANKEASHAAKNCRILGNLLPFSRQLRQSLVLRQRLRRPDQDSHPFHLIF